MIRTATATTTSALATVLILVASGGPASAAATTTVYRDSPDSYRASTDLQSVSLTDGDTAVTFRVKVRDLTSSGSYHIAFAEWDENWMRMSVTKRAGRKPRVALTFLNPETGQTKPAVCRLSVSWLADRDFSQVRIMRDRPTAHSCLYQDSGTQYSVGMIVQSARFTHAGTTDKLRP